MRIDLNCDVGEGIGPSFAAVERELLERVSSANIACGVHAGDRNSMQRSAEMALTFQVQIGAHPGLPDRVGFGRQVMKLSMVEVHRLVLEQLGALHDVVLGAGGRLRHVKPHGALYHMATTDVEIALGITEAVREFDASLMIYGFPTGALQEMSATAGLRYVREGFGDRAYLPDGSLVPRHQAGAVLSEPEQVAAQVLEMVLHSQVRLPSGDRVAVRPETICLHSDTANAAANAKAVRRALEVAGITICHLDYGR